MRQVREHIFLGSITDAFSVLQSSRTNITHMLSVFADELLVCSLITMGAAAGGGQCVPSSNPCVGTPARDSPGGFGIRQYAAAKRELVRKIVSLRDIESENLLHHLESCLEFIEEGKKSGGDVLVHCLAGISRSASVVTAYLMRTEKLSVNDGLASLREVSGGVCPNDGFIEQLRIFEEMGYKVDKESPIYKQFRVDASAGCRPAPDWLSFLDQVNNNVRGDSLRRSPCMRHIHNVNPPIKEKSLEKGIKSKDSSGVPRSRVRMFRLWRRSASRKEVCS